MSTMASQITSLTIVHSIAYSDADQRKHQSSASLAFVWGIHRWPVNSPHKWSVTRIMFPFDDVIMARAGLISIPPLGLVQTTVAVVKTAVLESVTCDRYFLVWNNWAGFFPGICIQVIYHNIINISKITKIKATDDWPCQWQKLPHVNWNLIFL